MGATKFQLQAMEAYNDNYLISAGAGSGKTFVLAERVGFLVQNYNLKIDEFLLLTFTEPAAGEMKKRIRDKLRKIGSNEEHKVDNAYICTFDSFSLSLVKKYHYLLNLPKSISIINQNIINILASKEINEEFDKVYLTSDQKIISLINKYTFKDDSSLRNFINKLFQKLSQMSSKDEYLNGLISKSGYSFINSCLLEYEQKLDEYANTYYQTALESENQKYRNAVELHYESYSNASSLDDKVLCFKKWPARRNVEAELAFDLDNAKKRIQVLIKHYIPEKELISSINENEIFTKWIVSLLKRVINKVEDYKNKVGGYLFSDIAFKAIELLKKNEEIRLEVKNSFKAIMIDEYQDTSPIQEELISLISSNNVYMVGDIKQSIYRFRNANPSLFINKFDNYSDNQGGKLIKMDDNFRSRKEVLDDINVIFSKMMTVEYGEANYKKDHMINAGNIDFEKNKSSLQNYHLEFLSYPKKDTEYDEAEAIVKDIITKINNHYQVFDGKKLRDATLSDFCILMDRNTKFTNYEKVFKKYQIPLYKEANSDISSNMISLVMFSLLRVYKCIKDETYYNSYFKHALYSLLRSFIFSYSDEEIYSLNKNNILENEIFIKLKELYQENIDNSVYTLINKTVEYFSFYNKLILLNDISLNEKYLDEILKLLKSFNDFGFTLDEYITYFEQVEELELKIDISSSSSSFDAVRIMNMHKSKGLEFKIVYYSGLNVTFFDPDAKSDFYLSDKYGLIYPSFRLSKTQLYTLAHQYDKRFDISEKIRLFYVGLTRAKEKMIILKPENAKANPIEFMSKLGDIIYPFDGEFPSCSCLDDESLRLNYKENEVEPVKLECIDIDIELLKKENNKKASKDLSFSATSELLKYGERLHQYLQFIDFINPDLSLISSTYERKKIDKFLSSPLIKELKNPLIFKEYEYIEDDISRIIDCLIIDGDKAYIIDYKLKNIDDEAYNHQLKTYYNYVLKTFKLNTSCYLYSIFDEVYKELNF